MGGGSKALIPSCKGVDYKGNIIFVPLGEKEGKMRQKRIGQKKEENNKLHFSLCGR